jgi:hypothetical protein
VKKEAENFKADPNSEETWESQLEQFIDRRLESRDRESRERQWREEENARQVDFESKFTAGVNKYHDFEQVVSGKPIDGKMMLAIRGLENPAAFIYGAAKMHPQELERISRISDQYQQAAEIGRLHERMVKTRVAHSAAAKPLEAPKGDMSSKVVVQKSLEQRITEYAQQKRR